MRLPYFRHNRAAKAFSRENPSRRGLGGFRKRVEKILTRVNSRKPMQITYFQRHKENARGRQVDKRVLRRLRWVAGDALGKRRVAKKLKRLKR